jgi:hypothetical protein
MSEYPYKFSVDGTSFIFDYDTEELCCVLCKINIIHIMTLLQ